jgi:hypothetical protein
MTQVGKILLTIGCLVVVLGGVVLLTPVSANYNGHRFDCGTVFDHRNGFACKYSNPWGSRSSVGVGTLLAGVVLIVLAPTVSRERKEPTT